MAVRLRTLGFALVLLLPHCAALAQSLTVPAQFVYWTNYGPPGGPGTRYYYFATGDEACQFACTQGDSRCRDSTTSNTFTQNPGACYGPFTQTTRFWLTGSPYWDYDTTRGQHCKVPVRQTTSRAGPEGCGYAIGDPLPGQDNSWIQHYNWVGSGWICPLNYYLNSDKTCTLLYATAYPPPQRSPKCGNPVLAGSGCKIETIALTKVASGARSIPIELRYASLHPRGGGRLVGHQSWFLDPLDRRLIVPTNPTAVGAKVLVIRPYGAFEEFTRTTAGTWTGIDTRVRLEGDGPIWQLTDFDENTAETYDGLGRLAQFGYFDGSSLMVTYESATSARPTQVRSSIGGVVSFTHNTAGVETILLPDARQIRIGYQSQTVPGMPSGVPYLQTVTFEDDTVKSFAYAPASIAPGVPVSVDAVFDRVPRQAVGSPPFGTGIARTAIVDYAIGGRSPFTLDSIYDQLSNRYARFEYDDQGRAILTEHAGGVDRYRFSHSLSGTTVTEPLGATTTFQLSWPPSGVRRFTHMSRSAPGLPTASFGGYIDSHGNMTSRWQWHAPSHNNCYASDPLLGREIVRVEALPYSSPCPSNLVSYVPISGTEQRKTLTEWHPDWRLPTRIAEPKKITTIVYHGGAANCAPSGAVVQGKPAAVVCSITEQATDDERGAQGFTAPAVGVPRTWSFTYTTYGRVLTATDPNSRTTSYTYYPDNDPNIGKRGNVASITNAANHITYITDYNQHGRPTRIVDPNGVVTVLTYDPRLRLTSHTQGSEATAYRYDPRGLIEEVTLPDGGRLTYTHDAAHRLTAINDHKGNRIDYTLDAMGNRTAEQVKDSGGVLVKNIARVIDALNRVERITGAMQ